MTREKERVGFQDKLYLAKVHKVIDTSRRDLANMKIFSSTPLNGNGALTSFIDDLRTETMAITEWERLTSVKSKNCNCQLLDRFTSITELEMKAAKKSRTTDKHNSAKNMYIATWRLIGMKVKREMNANREAISCDGPTFLWFIFKYYHSTAVQTVRTTLAKLNNLR